MVKAYIFDLDGTLLDSMPAATKTILGYLDEHGVDYPSDIIKTLAPLGYPGLSHYLVKEYSLGLTCEELYAHYMKRLAAVYATEIPAKDGAEKTLRTLKARGYRLNILTGSPHAFLDPAIKRLGWEDLFENVWGVEDFSTNKSVVETFVEAAKRLKLSSAECVMVDDSVHSLRFANQAGMKTIGCYDVFSAENENEIRTFADGYIKNFKELL
ncbi:MAG: HAD family phosphatase [Clostridia bacterium]|nr:HAD family phosphatase [Clostridia bacterium]